jgi:hypothetical protein
MLLVGILDAVGAVAVRADRRGLESLPQEIVVDALEGASVGVEVAGLADFVVAEDVLTTILELVLRVIVVVAFVAIGALELGAVDGGGELLGIDEDAHLGAVAELHDFFLFLVAVQAIPHALREIVARSAACEKKTAGDPTDP